VRGSSAVKSGSGRTRNRGGTRATLLLLAGESLKVVSERLGHTTITLTADTYSHVLPTMQRAAADKLDAMFNSSG